MEKIKMLWTGEPDAHWEKIFSDEFALTKATMAVTGSHKDVLCAKPDFAASPEIDQKVIDMIADNEVLFIGYDGLPENVIKSCPDVRLIISVRDGPEEHIDIDAATKAGIPVLFSGGRCVHAVAETTVALMLMLARRVAPILELVREERWTQDSFWKVRELCAFRTELFRKNLSLIGCGRNALEIVKICRGFDMNIRTYDPYLPEERAAQYGVAKVSLEEALRQGDYIVMMARVTPETTGMINRERIALMKPTAYFINTARAALTDEEAVIDALIEGRIGGAAIDVAGKEPLGEKSRFYDIPADKLILTPHISGGSQERVSFQYELCWNSLQNFLKGSREITIKNPSVFDEPAFAGRGGKLFGIKSN